jgi:hypothetical protein
MVTFTGITYDRKSKDPLNGVKVSFSNFLSVSNSRGEYQIQIPEEEFTSNKKVLFTFSQPNFEEKNVRVSPSKTQVNVGLKTLQDFKDDALTENLPLKEQEINQLSKPNFEQFQQKRLNDLVKTLKVTLIPIIINLLLEFGITDQSSPTPKSCPSPEKMRRIIEKRNKLTKQLEISLTTIDTTLKALGILEGILLVVEIAQKSSLAIPLPTPPIVSKIISVLEEQIKKYKNINRGLISILFILRSTIQSILTLLSTLDKAIQECSKEDETLVQLNLDILNEVNMLNQQTSVGFESINGFTFDIEIESTQNTLKRRRAIAKNNKGVILLRGEYSYSSSDKILIDELIFFIKVNNLKAD